MYYHRYYVKFHILDEMTKDEKDYLTKLIKNKDITPYINNYSIITSSIQIIDSSSENDFLGELEIPLKKFQEHMQRSELIYIWNDLIKKFNSRIKFTTWEQWYFE